MKDFLYATCIGSISGFIGGFLGGWAVWQLTKGRKNRKEKQLHAQRELDEFLHIKKQVLKELELNTSSGLGNPSCNFQFGSIKALVEHKKSVLLGTENCVSLQEIIKDMMLCNDYGGIAALKRPPGTVKSMYQLLKDRLEKVDIS